MSWAAKVSSAVRPCIVAHHDLDGIARSAIALLSEEFGNAIVHIVYSRQHPATNPVSLPQYLTQIPQNQSPVLFIDIAVDVRNPQGYINALAEFSKSHYVIWTEHHETDIAYLRRITEALVRNNSIALWAGPSAYDYSIALAMWLNLDPNSQDVQDLAILSAIGDRDPKILSILREEQIRHYYEVGNGLDVIIRDMSSRMDPTNYESLAKDLANNRSTVLSEALRRSREIPTITRYETIRPSVVALEELLGGWGPKSLERLALRTDTPYAFGVSFDPRTQTYVIRAITLWTKLTQYTPIGDILAKHLHDLGLTFFGPPAAIVITGFRTFEEARDRMFALAEQLTQEVYVPKITTLINERSVAQALNQDFSTILSKLAEILETQKQMYEEYLSLKKRQVELLEGVSSSDRQRYD